MLGRQPSDCRPGTNHKLKLVTIANYVAQNDCKDELLKLINFACTHARCEDIVIRRRPSLDTTKQKSMDPWRQEEGLRWSTSSTMPMASASSVLRPLLRMRIEAMWDTND